MVDWDKQQLRSLLFAPASEVRKLSRLASFGADAVVLDLEDAVAETEKNVARVRAREALAWIGERALVLVRVNGVATGLLMEDLEGIVAPGVDGIIVPKVESLTDVTIVEESVRDLEIRRKLPPGSVRIFIIIESALGLVRCEDILQSSTPWVHTVIFGSADFTSDLGIELGVGGADLRYPRARLSIAARAAGLAPAIDGPYLNIVDEEGLLKDSDCSRRLGFQGRVAIHPRQVVPIQRAYSRVSAEDFERAIKIVRAFEDAEQQGVASICVDGQFIDYPIYRRARDQVDRQSSLPRRENSRIE